MRSHFGNDRPSQGASVVLRFDIAISALLTLCLFLGNAQARKAPIRGRSRPRTRLILVCDNGNRPVSDTELASIVQVLQARLARFGLQSEAIKLDAANRGRLVITLPAESDVNRIKSLLTYVGKLELRPVVHGTDRRYPDKKSADADARNFKGGIDSEIVEFRDVFRDGASDSKQTNAGGWIILEKTALIGNGDIIKATPGTRYGDRMVDFTLSQVAADRFGQWTSSHIGDSLAVVLDGVVKSVPTVQSKITDRGVITGSFDEAGAEDLAFALESGMLPVPL